MKILTEVTNHKRLIRVIGALDAVGIHSEGDALLETILKEPSDAIIDLQEVNFIDTSGLGILVAALKRIRSRGNCLVIQNVRGQPFELFAKLKLLSIFSIASKETLSPAMESASTWTIDRDAA